MPKSPFKDTGRDICFLASGTPNHPMEKIRALCKCLTSTGESGLTANVWHNLRKSTRVHFWRPAAPRDPQTLFSSINATQRGITKQWTSNKSNRTSHGESLGTRRGSDISRRGCENNISNRSLTQPQSTGQSRTSKLRRGEKCRR